MKKTPTVSERGERLEIDEKLFMPLILETCDKVEKLLPENLRKTIDANNEQQHKEGIFESIIHASREITKTQAELFGERISIAWEIPDNDKLFASQHKNRSRIDAHFSAMHQGMQLAFEKLNQLAVELEQNTITLSPLVALPKILAGLKAVERSGTDLINNQKRRVKGATQKRAQAKAIRGEISKTWTTLTGTVSEKDEAMADILARKFPSAKVSVDSVRKHRQILKLK